MNFQESISTCFAKYATFAGRASRSEFWWFHLFCILVYLAVRIYSRQPSVMDLAMLILFLPSLAVSARRLHDIGRSGWWYLLTFLPIIGTIVLIVWWATESKEAGNRYDAT
jgi:uncharacterized membrane protein YhaH (DUF805 family)